MPTYVQLLVETMILLNIATYLRSYICILPCAIINYSTDIDIYTGADPGGAKGASAPPFKKFFKLCYYLL